MMIKQRKKHYVDFGLIQTCLYKYIEFSPPLHCSEPRRYASVGSVPE